ncbi:MAG: hypothetical protein JWP91_260 [Fibrobacteres bacterium]|nr:hypothetical protein [Fibrobacterota bacterium]
MPYVLLLGAALLWLIACLWFPLTDTDIWWHLASAKLMWAGKAFLREDPFCQSSLGAPWTDLHWGFQSLAYLAWKIGGARALIAGKCLALAGALGFALKPHLDRRTAAYLIPLAAFGIYQVRFFIDVRPLALTLLGLGAQYAAVLAYFRGGIQRPWPVPLILISVQIAMVNTQGLYPLGALLVSCLVIGEYTGRRLPAISSAHGAGSAKVHGSGSADPGSVPLRPLALASAVLWLMGFVSPYGAQGFFLPLTLLGRIAPVSDNIFSSEIAENQPFGGLLLRDPGAALPFLFFAALTAYSFVLARSRTSLGHAMIFLAFAALGWMAQRNLPLAFLAGLMAAGRNIQVYLALRERERVSPRSAGFSAWGGMALMAAIALLYGPRIRAAWDFELPGSLETPFRFPVQAAEWMAGRELPGNMFNELRYGGYLEFRLFPSERPFVDGRMILRSPGFYREFLDAVDHPDRFDGYRARYGFTHAVLPISEDKRFLPLAAHLIREGGWDLLYCDGASVIVADSAITKGKAWAIGLDSLPHDHPLRIALQRRFGSNPRLASMAVLNSVLFLRTAGRERAAADLLAE